MAGFGPASLPHLALILDTLAPGGSAKAPAPLPSLGLVMYDAGQFGSLNKSLGSLTAAGVGKVVVTGSLGKTLSSISISSVGSVVGLYGSIESPVPLPHLASLMPTISGIIGQAFPTLESMTVISEGDVPGNEIWPYEYDDKPPRTPLYWPHAKSITWFQTDTVLRDSGGGRTGVLGQSLAPLTIFARSSPIVGGTLTKTLDAISRSAAGTVAVAGSVSKSLGAMTVSSAGSTLSSFVGTLARTLDTLTISSAASGGIACSTIKTLGSLTVSSRADSIIGGSLSKTLQGINSNIDATVLSGYVAVVNSFLSPLTCVARIGGDSFVTQNSGGWPIRPKKRRVKKLERVTEDEFYDSLPAPSEVADAKEKVAELPKRAKEAVRKIVTKATSGVNPEQAAILAGAYLHEPMQEKLADQIAREFDKARVKLRNEIMTDVHALVLGELARQANVVKLEQVLKEQQAEEEDIQSILDLWVNL